MDKHQQQQQLFLAKSTRQRCNEWIFRDVPSDITIEVNGVAFALHKLYCVSDYLEMTEEFSKDNLGSRTEEYLEIVVCKNLEMCVEVLQQCESLLPLADELKIISRCIDAIASKACAEQIASSFSRLEYSSSGRLHMNRQTKCEGDWWIEDLSVIQIDLYQRLITAMKCRGVRPESIGASLVNFAQKELTKKCSLWNPSGLTKVDLGSTDHEQLVVEAIIGLLPVEKLAVPISFLFGLLRSAVMLDCSISCRLDLERRIGSMLDIATLDDILIPSFRHSGDGTLFDVDTVQRILVNFSQQDDSEGDMDDESVFESDSPRSPSQTALFKVAILVDNYLAEIAPDANLKLPKFLGIAETLPEHARTIHDGLYRAIDIYLKAHPGLLDEDRKRLCKLIDFQKLSQEAGAHAAQNERLPIQSIVQVLYFEQLRLRNALCCSYPDDDHKPAVHHQSWRISSGALSAAMSPRDNYASLRRENRELKLELTRMRMRLNDLEKEHVCMKRDMVKSRSRRFMRSFSKKIGKLSLFGRSSSRGSSSPSRQSYRTDSKVIERTCASTD
ncbi:hypothetical protein ERO13_A08G194400v2 [Gossypium hirsutum]|nr:hypothetical protein ERO13_A08G194400v2 [Gossypium hirsutum]